MFELLYSTKKKVNFTRTAGKWHLKFKYNSSSLLSSSLTGCFMKVKIDRKKFSRQQTEKLSECSRAIYIRADTYRYTDE